jgi:hypothetical protein
LTYEWERCLVERLTLNAVFLLNVFGGLLGLVLLAVVPDGDVGAGLSKGLGHAQPDAGTGARDDGCLALEGEEGEHAVRLGDLGCVVREVAAFHVRHVDCAGWMV